MLVQVAGAVDPNSGTCVLMELARTFGEMVKMGWRPRRTIVFASWDAEEYALVMFLLSLHPSFHT